MARPRGEKPVRQLFPQSGVTCASNDGGTPATRTMKFGYARSAAHARKSEASRRSNTKLGGPVSRGTDGSGGRYNAGVINTSAATFSG